MKDNKCIGHVTSGGYAHYVKKSIAFGYIPTELSKENTNLEVEINGILYPAKTIRQPLYDPEGRKMKE